jgi:long-chain fatty acid transport protein
MWPLRTLALGGMFLIMSYLHKYLPAVLISGVCAGRLFANGFGILNQDAFATARGQAFVATADNPSAIYYNPAGIAQLTGDNVRGGVGGYYLNSTFIAGADQPNPGVTYHSAAYHYAAVPDGYYTHTFEDLPLTVGLGMYSPYGGNVDWPGDTGFNTIAIEGRLLYLTINPAVALKVTPHLLLGVGVMANYVNLYTEQSLIPFQTIPANFFKFKGDGWSAGYNLGALYQPAQWVSFGATFRSSATVNLRGHSNFQEPPTIQTTTLPAQMPLTFPLTVVLGVSVRPTPQWNLEFDANYTGWESFGTTTLSQDGTTPFGVNQDITVNFGWRGSWIYEVGITRYFGKDWHVSAGYAFDQNSVPSQYYSPLAADMDRHFFSIGAGYQGKTIDFDVTYQFGYGPGNSAYNSLPSSTAGSFSGQTADGKYTFQSNTLLVSAGIHF